jgi:hypothetical protein
MRDRYLMVAIAQIEFAKILSALYALQQLVNAR